MIINKFNKKGLALSQIIIILLGTIAFSYIVGSEIGFVSAAGDCKTGGVSGSTFCYGNSQFGYYTYTVTSAGTITRNSDGSTYTLIDGQWTYNGKPLSSTKDNPPLFNSYANQASNNYKTSQTAAAQTPQIPSVTDAAPTTPPSSDIFTIATQAGSAANCVQALSSNPEASNICGSIYNSLAGGTDVAGAVGTPEGVPSGAGAAAGAAGAAVQVSPWDTAAKKFGDLFSGGGAGGGVVPVQTIGGGALNIVAAAAAAIGVYAVFGWIKGNFADFFKEHPGWSFAYDTLQAAATGFTAGIIAAPTLVALFPGITSGLAWGGIGAGVAILIFLITYREGKTDTVIVSCVPWQAPTGGADCSKCGQNGLPCTAYQCASLGTGCELLNAGTGEGKPVCNWVDEGDTAPPTMKFLASVLPAGYTYEPLNPPAEYPRDTGVLIKYNGGEIPPYTTLPIGIINDKTSKCKIDYTRGKGIDEMSFVMFGGVNGNEGLWGKNHTLSVPIFQEVKGNVSVKESGEVNLYVRCESRNGYSDVNAFVIQFNVDQTPDQTAPDIKGTDLLNGAPIAMGTSSLDLHVYVNEPVSGCKWSQNNYDYENMENNMTCPNNIATQGSFAGTYPCTAHLNGLNDGIQNKFYFLCNDTTGNVAKEDNINPFILTGTQALAITSVTPADNTIIKGSTDNVKITLKVTTSAGAIQGKAKCYYSSSGASGTYNQFGTTNAHLHSTDLRLLSGSYNYYIRCIDDGGNSDEETVNFVVETDTAAPIVVRASHENANLNIKTNEEAKCVYDIVDCNYPFENGIPMSTSDKITHSAAWVAGRTYYIKCNDLFGNPPSPDSCNAILSSSEI